MNSCRLSLACLAICLLNLGSIKSVAAQMQYPLDVAAAEDGTLYVADRKLPGIWKVVDGKASIYFQGEKTFRTPLNAVRCLFVDAEGTLFAGDSATREVYVFDKDGKPKPLTNGFIGIPSDLWIEGDTVFVSDLETQRIWSFPKTGGKPEEIAVIAGVRGLARHTDGGLLCCTTLENPLRRVGDDGSLEVLLADRPFQMPHHIVLIDKHLYVADNYANTIWKVNLEGEPQAVAFAAGAPLQKPVGLSVQKDDLIVADPHAKALFRITPEGKVTEIPAE